MNTKLQIAARSLLLGVTAFSFLVTPAFGQNTRESAEEQIACKALNQTYSLRSTLQLAINGEAEAFSKLKFQLEELQASFNGNLSAPLTRWRPIARAIDTSGQTFLSQQNAVVSTREGSRDVMWKSLALTNDAQEVAVNERAARQPRIRADAAQHLVTLLENISQNARGLGAVDFSAEAAFDLGKNLNDFAAISRGLIDGDKSLKIPVLNNLQQRARLQKLIDDYVSIRTSAGQILGNLQQYVSSTFTATQIQTLTSGLVSELQPVCYPGTVKAVPGK